MCKKVYLIHRRDELRAIKSLQEKLFKQDNIEILWNTEIEEIIGKDEVEKIKIVNNKNNDKSDIEVNGVFVAIGSQPNSQLLMGKVKCDEKNWIITDEECETNIKGVFAAGDVRKKSLRQIITGVADGAISVNGVIKYI
jgi:thioredoxin reductase (NADPH)